jgi:hypothetical protein
MVDNTQRYWVSNPDDGQSPKTQYLCVQSCYKQSSVELGVHELVGWRVSQSRAAVAEAGDSSGTLRKENVRR